MNSKLLRILAGLLAIGAATMGWIGYHMSVQAPAAALPPPPTFPQVVAAHNISVGQLLKSDDVRLVSVPQADPKGYKSTGDVLGKLTVEPIAEGAALITSNFALLGPIAQSLHPDERAVAVKVNEVIGVGGFISPGDHVDVLLYLRADQETGNTSSAQVILSDARVLAYGDELGEQANQGQTSVTDVKNSLGTTGDAKPDPKKGKEGRSAILAVPEKDASRLMLADSGGILRLALRGAKPLQQVAAGTDNNQFVRLGDVAQLKPAQSAPLKLAQMSEKKKVVQKKDGAVTNAKREQVIVHRGDHMEVVNVVN